MFFRKRQKDDGDAQFGKLDELVGSSDPQNPVEEGIRRALERDDLSDADRADFEAALKRLEQQNPPD
jgi:hypothetical protein